MTLPTYPPAPQLNGARSKLKQGLVHADLIKAEVDRVTGPDAYSVVLEVENNGRKHSWKVVGLKAFDERLPLWIGDCMHNLRSAWDHIAYELINAAPSLTPSQHTMFPLLAQQPNRPVYISPAPGPHPDAMTIVEHAQPYQMGNSDSLAILDHLDIVDKHRELLAVAASVHLPYYSGGEGVELVGSWANGNAIKDGFIVMQVITKHPQPEDTFSGNVVLTTKLAQEFLPMPLPDAPTLTGLIDDIENQLTWNLGQFDWFFATH